MHQHKCSLCGTMWQHGEEWDRDMLAHECPVCGCHQFRLFKVRGKQTAALPEQTCDKLLEAFASADPFVRSTTLFALNVADRAVRGVLPNVATMATADPEVLVRLAAVETLRRFGADAVAALPALAQALADRHPEVRRAAALTLGDLGTAGSALTALTGRLSDNHPRSTCSCRGFGKDSTDDRRLADQRRSWVASRQVSSRHCHGQHRRSTADEIRITAVDRRDLVLARRRQSFGERSIAGVVQGHRTQHRRSVVEGYRSRWHARTWGFCLYRRCESHPRAGWHGGSRGPDGGSRVFDDFLRQYA